MNANTHLFTNHLHTSLQRQSINRIKCTLYVRGDLGIRRLLTIEPGLEGGENVSTGNCCDVVGQACSAEVDSSSFVSPFDDESRDDTNRADSKL